MSYQDKCIQGFMESMKEYRFDKTQTEIVRQTFIAGFEYGSLNGASDSIKQQVLDRMKPVKDEKAKEVLKKIKELIQ